MHSMSWGSRVFQFPFIGEIRPMTPVERQLLRDSIFQQGRILNPVIITPGDEVIDGVNRLTLAKEIGLRLDQVPFKVEDVDIEKAREMCREMNEKRRHLTKEDLDKARESRRSKVAEMRQQGMTTREIAEQVGCATSTVFNDLDNDPSVQARTDGPLLKRREEVLVLRNEGQSRKEIAEVLGIAEKTVKNDLDALKKQGRIESEMPRGRPRRNRNKARAQEEAKRKLEEIKAEWDRQGCDHDPRVARARKESVESYNCKISLKDPSMLIAFFQRRVKDQKMTVENVKAFLDAIQELYSELTGG